MRSSRRFVCVHGHFYQPPRENPWLESIEVQESAAPYHDWNARINHECYAANGNSRILNSRNKIVRIVNNYSRISFNFGPTLLAWMEKSAPITYQRVLDADRVSSERFGGHGSAIAQVYNHAILPLAKTQDRMTQIRWGIADFEHRFRRMPEGMWLAETAADLESLDLLAQCGIRFTILAPHQCARVRAISTENDPEAPVWHETPNADVDPTMPYLVRTKEGRSIAVFFYDGPISRAVAFEGLLNNGGNLAKRLLRGYRENGQQGQLVHIATDGESYGHHHRHGDMALAYALQWIERHGDAELTNYGQFLERFPPAYEATIYEDTSWSCAHGLERWRSNCGCGNSGDPSRNQEWRAPLRAALDWLRDSARSLGNEAALKILKDPAGARDSYIRVILERGPASQQAFLEKFALHPYHYNGSERIRIWKLLEMERHIQLMYTSCAWFFDELSGIETTQIISYAGRVLQLASALFGEAGLALEPDFLDLLARAHGNPPDAVTGADIYRKIVMPQMVALQQVGARYAIVSLFEPQAEKTTRYCYEVTRKSAETLESGRKHFSYGQARICSLITTECEDVDYAVLHLGDQDLSAAVRKPSKNANNFHRFVLEVREAVARDDFAEASNLLVRDFGSMRYSLSSLFYDDRRRILQLLLDTTLSEMETTLRTVYQDHNSLLNYLNASGVPKPLALTLVAQFTLNADLRQALPTDPFDAPRVKQLLSQVRTDGIVLDAVTLPYIASQRLLRAMENLRQHRDKIVLEDTMQILDVMRELPLEIDLWETQNHWYRILQECPFGESDSEWSQGFRELGIKLDLDVDQLIVDY